MDDIVLVISSHVAGSRVGGNLAYFVLPPLGLEPMLVPTCLFGRHPGYGPPGGTMVAPETMDQMLDAVAQQGLFERIRCVITGHFSNPEQIDVTAKHVALLKKEWARGGAGRPRQVIVDPIMGDTGAGLYVKEDVAEAIGVRLLPLADIVAPNLWEFARLTGVERGSLTSADAVAHAARKAGGSWLISSVPTQAGIGVLRVLARPVVGDEAWKTACLAETPEIAGRVPKGTGDLLTLRFAGAIDRAWPHGQEGALGRATGLVYAMIERAVELRAGDLPFAQARDLLVDAPLAHTRWLRP
jgi:pyridoxine kinase